MERSVEALLTMVPAGAGAAPAGAAPAGAGGAIPASAAPSSQQFSGRKARVSESVGLDISQPLPDDFLRPPSYFLHVEEQRRQEEEDRILAQLLQDEYFMRELRRNPDRYSDQAPRAQPQPAEAPAPAPVAAPAPAPSLAPVQQVEVAPAVPSAVDSDQELDLDDDGSAPVSVQEREQSVMQRFSQLGDAAREKLRKLAARMGARDLAARMDAHSQSAPKSGSGSGDADGANYMALPSLDDMDDGKDGMDQPSMELGAIDPRPALSMPGIDDDEENFERSDRTAGSYEELSTN
jgi:hypothetical protein